MGKLLFSFYFGVCTLSTAWGMTNRDSKNIDPMGVNIDPAAETIDMEAFREQYSLDEADVIRFLNEINEANENGNGVQLVNKSFVSVPRIRCEDGPIQVVHQVNPNVFIFPIPLKYTCNRLYCKDYECMVREKERVCHLGMYYIIRRGLVVSRGTRRVCYDTHLRCGCKTCEDFKTPKECNNITPCPNLQNTTSQQTKCYWAYPKALIFNTVIMPPRGRCSCCDLNQKCPSPKMLDRNSCECQCPEGSKEDKKTGNCIGRCQLFHGSDKCKEIFCKQDPSKQCTLINAKCECSKNISSCEEISDPDECDQTICPGSNSTPPTMCKNITDANVCANSTCLGQPNLACRYSNVTRCHCPSCCQDHPDQINDFDCASLHMAGTAECNGVKDGRTCQWKCACSDIDNQKTCLSSTCDEDPDKICKYEKGSCLC